MNGLQKYKKKISRWLFEIIHIIRFEIWDLRSTDLKIFLAYDINYLSIWPFIGHPWFPTRKASKLTFACFQLAGWWPCDCFQLAGWCHSSASWKQTNINFEAFLGRKNPENLWLINGYLFTLSGHFLTTAWKYFTKLRSRQLF